MKFQISLMEEYCFKHNCNKCGTLIEVNEEYTLVIAKSYTPANQNFVIICAECLATDDTRKRKILGELLLSLEKL